MRYSNPHNPRHPQFEQVKVAVLADSLREEQESQQPLWDLLLGGAAIASAVSVFLLMH